MAEGQEHFGIGLDVSKLQQDAEKAKKAFEDIGKEAESQGKVIDNTFSRIAKSAALIGAGFSANELVSKITQVRGEFQQLEVAFMTMLRSEEKAEQLMSQLVRTAATTPFDLQSVSQGAKQLLAYGESVEKVNDDLVMLGNIAAGLSIPLGDLVYLYGTTMTQGRLYTEDFNQFVGRGIPLISELSKQFGVAENEVKGLVEAGRVGFPQIQEALQNLTSEGGIFFNLMEKQSKTITGQLSNIEDSFSMMFNEIGKANEGIINDALSGVSYLVENYKSIGETLAEIAVAYGTYKAALVAVTALQKAHSAVLAQAVVEQKLAAAAGIQLSNAQAIAAARTKLLTASVKSLNAALIANPYTLVTTAVIGLGYGLYKLATYQTDYEKGLDNLKDSVSEFNTKVIEEQRNLQLLKGQLDGAKKGTEQYNEVKEKIIKNYSKYYDGLEEEIEKVGLTEQAYNKLTDAITKSFGARQYNKFSEEQQGILDEKVASNLEKIQDKMIEKLGVEAGSRYYAKLRDALIQGNLRLGSGYNEILGLDKELQGVLDNVSGKDSKLFYWQDVEKWIKNIITAQEAFDKLDLKAKQRFGIDTTDILPYTEETEEKEKITFKTLNEVISAIKKTEKKIEELRTKAQKGLIGAGDVEQVISELDTLKKTYKAMTGEEYCKVTNDKAKKQLEQYYEELIQLTQDNEERKIELEKKGADKEIALINLRYKRQIEAVKKLQEELKKAQGGKLTDEQQGIFGTALSGLQGMKQAETTAVQNKQLEAERKAMQEYLAEYGDYWNKRKAIAEKYQDEIANETTKYGKMSLQAEMTQALAKLDDEAQKKTSIIVKLFGNMADKTVDEMRKIATEAENLLAFIEGGQYTKGNAFGITEEQFKVLSQSPDELDKIRQAIERIRNEADASEPIFERIKDNLKEIFEKGDKNNNLNKLLQQLNEDVGKVLQSVGFLADAFSNLGDSLGSSALSGIGEGLNTAISTVSSAFQGASLAGSLGLGGIGMAAGAAVGVVSSLASSIAKIHDKKNEKRIQALQDQIDVLTESYDDLGRAIEKSYSTDASELIEDQNKLLEQQKVLIQQQIAEERDKKDSDENRIKEWEQQIQDINDAIEDNKQAAIDAVTGTDLMSAIDQFAQAYADAWASGTDAAKASTEAVKSLIKTSLLEFLKKQLSPDVEEFMTNLAEFMSDGIISPWEQMELDRIQKGMDDKANQYLSQVEDYFKDDGVSEQEASSRGFETMSQDTAEELNGRFTALYESNLRIENQISIGNVNLQATKDAVTQMRDITQNCYLELVEIRENTGAIVKPILQIQKDIAEVKQNTAKL